MYWEWEWEPNLALRSERRRGSKTLMGKGGEKRIQDSVFGSQERLQGPSSGWALPFSSNLLILYLGSRIFRGNRKQRTLCLETFVQMTEQDRKGYTVVLWYLYLTQNIYDIRYGIVAHSMFTASCYQSDFIDTV